MVFMGYYVYTAKSSDGSKVYVNMMSLLYGEYFYDRTIAEVLTSNPGSYAVEGTVVAIGRTGFLLADETGYIFSYMGPDFHSGYGNMRVGQELVVYGKTSLYGGRIQFSNPLFDYGDFNAEYVQPEPTALSAQEFADLALAETVNVEYITIEGILKRSGNYYNIDLGDIGVTASLVDPEIAFAGEGAIGDKVIFTGYYIYCLLYSRLYKYNIQ